MLMSGLKLNTIFPSVVRSRRFNNNASITKVIMLEAKAEKSFSVLIDVKSTFNKIQHLFFIKTT